MSIPDVTFERFAPSTKLALYVEHFWMVSAPGEQTPRREILIPNGRPMLVLSFAGPSLETVSQIVICCSVLLPNPL
jgi:hypothetical protein